MKLTPRRTKEQIAQTQGWFCYYCGMALVATDQYGELPTEVLNATNYPHLDHVIARHHGGSDDLDNLVVTCQRCNSRKGIMRIEAFLAKLAEEAPRPLPPTAGIAIPESILALMPVLADSELRVLLTIAYASERLAAPPTLEQLMAGSGLGRRAVIEGISAVIMRGVVERRSEVRDGQHTYTYELLIGASL